MGRPRKSAKAPKPRCLLPAGAARALRQLDGHRQLVAVRKLRALDAIGPDLVRKRFPIDALEAEVLEKGRGARQGKDPAEILSWLNAGAGVITIARIIVNSGPENAKYLHRHISQISAEISQLRAIYE